MPGEQPTFPILDKWIKYLEALKYTRRFGVRNTKLKAERGLRPVDATNELLENMKTAGLTWTDDPLPCFK